MSGTNAINVWYIKIYPVCSALFIIRIYKELSNYLLAYEGNKKAKVAEMIDLKAIWPLEKIEQINDPSTPEAEMGGL